MQSLVRPAPRPGKATTEDPHYVDTSAPSAHATSSAPAQQQKNLLSNAAAHLHASSTQRLLEVNQSDDQHVYRISTDVNFGAFTCACFWG